MGEWNDHGGYTAALEDALYHARKHAAEQAQRIAKLEEEIQAARAAIAPHGGSLVERITEVLADRGRCSQRIAELEAENNRLRAFAESVVLLGWTSSDDFAADVQEAALKANLIQTVPGGYDPEKHGPSDYCDPGDEYYEFTFPAGGE
jgi:chromosome segregation ATPase